MIKQFLKRKKTLNKQLILQEYKKVIPKNEIKEALWINANYKEKDIKCNLTLELK